jgi:hypothetical protein
MQRNYVKLVKMHGRTFVRGIAGSQTTNNKFKNMD